jgi:methionyl-tRNA formyltransferase
MPVTRSNTTRPVRALWFGMRCEFTRQALIGAAAQGSSIDPIAIVIPRGPRPRAAGWPEPPFDRWLRERGIQIIEVDRPGEDDLGAVRETIAATEPVLGVGACFPYKVPAGLRGAFLHGVLNIHPSLLPALRGPEPVFVC